MEGTSDASPVTADDLPIRAGEWARHDDDPWSTEPWAPALRPSYTRLKRINAGGQGEVWRARDLEGREVAIKYLTLGGNAAQQEEDRARFRREVSLQSMLDHPGVLPILGADLDGDEPHFLMPIAEESLRDRLARARTGLDPEDVRSIFGDTLVAVAHAHSRGVIHRDLKPENVLFVGGVPMLSDFGLGRRLYSGSTTLTITNAGMGTFAYSAPEQYNDAKHADERADVFALGRILYEMLCGQYAIQGLDMSRIPWEFRYAVRRATNPDRDKRFQTVDEFIQELSMPDSDGDGDDTSPLLAPSEQGKRLIEQVDAGAVALVPKLARVLVQNGDDADLYLDVLPTASETVLAGLALQAPEDYAAIMTTFDGYADGSHPFAFTDTLAVFLRRAFDVTADMEVRLLVVERLLVLGHTHNRWFVRDRFVGVVRAAMHEPEYVSAIAAILREHPDAHSFVLPGFDGVSLPKVIRDAMR